MIRGYLYYDLGEEKNRKAAFESSMTGYSQKLNININIFYSSLATSEKLKYISA